MTYTKKQFLEDVKKEARALKKNATTEELGRLDFHTFLPTQIHGCIYGQMTSDCFSERSEALIEKCAPIYIDYDSGYHFILPAEKRARPHWSPIEHYVRMADAQNANLIDFLKGNRKDLVL